jgi:hypothetical protein
MYDVFRTVAFNQSYLLRISSDHPDKGSPHQQTVVLIEPKAFRKIWHKKTTKHCSERLTFAHEDAVIPSGP